MKLIVHFFNGENAAVRAVLAFEKMAAQGPMEHVNHASRWLRTSDEEHRFLTNSDALRGLQIDCIYLNEALSPKHPTEVIYDLQQNLGAPRIPKRRR